MNYYAVTKDKKVVENYFISKERGCEFDTLQGKSEWYMIHIGKTSKGWKPLFEAHCNAYNSVEEMIIFFGNRDNIFSFCNEDRRRVTFNQLINELVYWEQTQIENNGTRYFKWYDHGYSGMLEEVKPDDAYDLIMPFDHIDYHNICGDSFFRNGFWRDKNGYNFSDREFL